MVGEGILPRYLYHELRVTKDAYGFDRTYRPKLDNLRALVTARIPVNPDGSFDMETQRRVAERYDHLQSLQAKLIEHLQAFAGIQVVL